MRSAALLIGAALSLSAAGCASPRDYARDRLLDLSDVFDVKYGAGLGLGVHVQATNFIETGLGFSVDAFSREWFGRRSIDVRGAFAHVIVLGADGMAPCCSDPPTYMDILCINLRAFGRAPWTGSEEWVAGEGEVPILDRFRFGGVVYVPGGHLGLCVNVGEFFDFLGGLFTADLMNDDGIPKQVGFETHLPDA
jgi:hypothetical protein